MPAKSKPEPTIKDRNLPLSEQAMLRRAETTRLRIKTAELIDRLQQHVLGKKDLTPTQLAAAQTLLKKVLPDMVSAKAEVTGAPVVFNLSMTPKSE